MRRLVIGLLLAGCGAGDDGADGGDAGLGAVDDGMTRCDPAMEAGRCCPATAILEESNCPAGTRYMRTDRLDLISTECWGVTRTLQVDVDRATGGVTRGRDWTTRSEASDLLIDYSCYPATGYRRTLIRQQAGVKCIEPCLSEAGDVIDCEEIVATTPPCAD